MCGEFTISGGGAGRWSLTAEAQRLIELLQDQSLSAGLWLLRLWGHLFDVSRALGVWQRPQGGSVCPHPLFSHLPTLPTFHPMADEMDLQTRSARLGEAGSAEVVGTTLEHDWVVHGMYLWKKSVKCKIPCKVKTLVSWCPQEIFFNYYFLYITITYM